jgi:hypothetical protein
MQIAADFFLFEPKDDELPQPSCQRRPRAGRPGGKSSTMTSAQAQCWYMCCSFFYSPNMLHHGTLLINRLILYTKRSITKA